MGIIIRTAYNNNNWAGRCKNARRNNLQLKKCWNDVFNTGWKVDKKGNCLADCWECKLCRKYRWTNINGNFNKERAFGNAYFIFTDINTSLVLWGKSKIKKVENDQMYFNKFNAFPPERWIRNLSAQQLLGQKWGHGTFRYIDTKIEKNIGKLIVHHSVSKSILKDPIEPEITDREGRKILMKHLGRERSTKLIAKFKQSLTSYSCVICGFNFAEKYGLIGNGFIEAHHVKPIARLRENEKVSIKNLVAVCSNCHRMLHKEMPPLEWKKFRKMIKK